MRFSIVSRFNRHGLYWVAPALPLWILLICPRSQAQDLNSSHWNTLSAEEKASGWKLLFDGKTTSEWRGFRRSSFPQQCWTVAQEMLTRVKSEGDQGKDCGDIITVEQYDNFDLKLEWKVEPGGNSGVKYFILEERPSSWEQAYLDQYRISLQKSGRSETGDLTRERWKYRAMGFELQLIDDLKNADALKDPSRTTGALYDLIAPIQPSTLQMTQFNTARIVANGSHVEHWINGVRVVAFETGSSSLQELIVKSKFRNLTGFGEVKRGHIALQDHNSTVSFRNIKICRLAGNNKVSQATKPR